MNSHDRKLQASRCMDCGVPFCHWAWRQKEQFSDGVGYNWIDTLKAITSAAVSDEQMEQAAERFPINTPMNKEEYYYRSIFEEHFPSDSAARSVPSVPSVACSTAEALA